LLCCDRMARTRQGRVSCRNTIAPCLREPACSEAPLSSIREVMRNRGRALLTHSDHDPVQRALPMRHSQSARSRNAAFLGFPGASEKFCTLVCPAPGSGHTRFDDARLSAYYVAELYGGGFDGFHGGAPARVVLGYMPVRSSPRKRAPGVGLRVGRGEGLVPVSFRALRGA